MRRSKGLELVTRAAEAATRFLRRAVVCPNRRDFAEGVLLLVVLAMALPPRLLLAASPEAADSHMFRVPRGAREVLPTPEEESTSPAPRIEMPSQKALDAFGEKVEEQKARATSAHVKLATLLRSLPPDNPQFAFLMRLFERYVDGAKNATGLEKRLFEQMSKSRSLTRERLVQIVKLWKEMPDDVHQRVTPKRFRSIPASRGIGSADLLPAILHRARQELPKATKKETKRGAGTGSDVPAPMTMHTLREKRASSSPFVFEKATLRQILQTVDPTALRIVDSPASKAKGPVNPDLVADIILRPSIVRVSPGKTALEQSLEKMAAKMAKDGLFQEKIGTTPSDSTIEAIKKLGPMPSFKKPPPPPDSAVDEKIIRKAPELSFDKSSEGVDSRAWEEIKRQGLLTNLGNANEPADSTIDEAARNRGLEAAKSGGQVRNFGETNESQSTGALAKSEFAREIHSAMLVDRIVLGDYFFVERTYAPKWHALETTTAEFFDSAFGPPVATIERTSMLHPKAPTFKAPPMPLFAAGRFLTPPNSLSPDKEYLLRVCSRWANPARLMQHLEGSDSSASPFEKVCTAKVPVDIWLSIEDQEKLKKKKEAWELAKANARKPKLLREHLYPGDVLTIHLGDRDFSTAKVSFMNTYLGSPDSDVRPSPGPFDASLQHKRVEGEYFNTRLRLEVPRTVLPDQYIVAVQLEGTKKGKKIEKTRFLGPLRVLPFAYRFQADRVFAVTNQDDDPPDQVQTVFSIERDGRKQSRIAGNYKPYRVNEGSGKTYRPEDRYVLYAPSLGQKKGEYPNPAYRMKDHGESVYRPVDRYLAMTVLNWEWDEGGTDSEAILSVARNMTDQLMYYLEQAMMEYLEELVVATGLMPATLVPTFFHKWMELGFEKAVEWLASKIPEIAHQVAADINAASVAITSIHQAVWIIGGMVAAFMLMLLVIAAVEGSKSDFLGYDVLYLTASDLQLMTAQGPFVSNDYDEFLHTDEEVVVCYEEFDAALETFGEAADSTLQEALGICSNGDGKFDEDDEMRIKAHRNDDFSELKIFYRIDAAKKCKLNVRSHVTDFDAGQCSLVTECDPFGRWRGAGQVYDVRSGLCADGVDPGTLW